MFSRLCLCLFSFLFLHFSKIKSAKVFFAVRSLPGGSHQTPPGPALLKGQSISQTYQRESPLVVTTSTSPDTLSLLSSHPGLSHFLLTLWPPREGEGGFPAESKGSYSPKIKDITHHPAAEHEI